MNELQIGDRIRLMEPMKVPMGFIDCRTILTVSQIDPLMAYWEGRKGRKVYVPIVGEVDKVLP